MTISLLAENDKTVPLTDLCITFCAGASGLGVRATTSRQRCVDPPGACLCLPRLACITARVSRRGEESPQDLSIACLIDCSAAVFRVAVQGLHRLMRLSGLLRHVQNSLVRRTPFKDLRHVLSAPASSLNTAGAGEYSMSCMQACT